MTGEGAIGLLDDDRAEAESLAEYVEDVGYTPDIMSTELLMGLDLLLRNVRDVGHRVVICDHRLGHRAPSTYDGAEAVARLNAEGVPALLVSTWMTTDADASVRRYRAGIPVALSRSELTGPELRDAIQVVEDELRGVRRPGRQPHRVSVVVQRGTIEDGVPVLEVIVPAWRPNEGLRLPLALVDDELHPQGDWPHNWEDQVLIAEVNIGAASADEIYFQNFEAAPSVDDE